MKNQYQLLFIALFLTLITSCKSNDKKDPQQNNTNNSKSITTSSDSTAATAATGPIADAATILARREVPILCYHQIRDWKASDSKNAKDIIVPIQVFKEHMKILADSGYHTILPDQLYAYLTRGAALPSKPVMLTFDDTDIDQYTIGWNEMKKYGFKGVFFIMTVSINRLPHYMTKEQLKELSDAGNLVTSHTWNHERVPSYTTDEKWHEQIEKPKKTIEDITGKPSDYFAYPYGLWNKPAIPELKKRGIKAAFILSTKRDENDPLYTIRRMIGSGYWSAQGMYKSMITTFHLQ